MSNSSLAKPGFHDLKATLDLSGFNPIDHDKIYSIQIVGSAKISTSKGIRYIKPRSRYSIHKCNNKIMIKIMKGYIRIILKHGCKFADQEDIDTGKPVASNDDIKDEKLELEFKALKSENALLKKNINNIVEQITNYKTTKIDEKKSCDNLVARKDPIVFLNSEGYHLLEMHTHNMDLTKFQLYLDYIKTFKSDLKGELPLFHRKFTEEEITFRRRFTSQLDNIRQLCATLGTEQEVLEILIVALYNLGGACGHDACYVVQEDL
jgi:hypothetical protein